MGKTRYGIYGICWYGLWKKHRTCYGIVGGMVREKHSMWYGTLAVCYDGTVSWIYSMTKHRMWYGIVGGMVREKHSMWYGMLAVWYDGTVSWIYVMAKFAWCYGMFQYIYIRSVRVEYVVRISSVTTLYINHWMESVHADRQTDRQADKQIRKYRNWHSVQTENERRRRKTR